MAGHHQALDLHLLLSPIPKPLLATTLPFKCARTLQAALAVPIRSQFHAAIWEKYNTIINCLLWKYLQKPLYFRTEAWVVEMTTLQGQLWQVKVADQSGKTSTGALGSRYDDE
uniref:Uncharacterized protein n=1 Tax=Oryza glaberrima TaxID=4538 RepID=I1QK26_ORYGL